MEGELNPLVLRNCDVPGAVGLRLVVLGEVLSREDAAGTTELILEDWKKTKVGYSLFSVR